LGVLDDTERDEFCRDLASRPKLPVEIMDFLWAQDQENLKEILAVRWDIPKELRQRWLEAKKGKRWTTSDHTLQRNSHIPANEFHCPENWVRKQSDWWRPSEAPGLVQEFAAAPSRRVKAVILHDRAGDDLPDWGVFYYQTPYRMTLWQRPGDDRWLGAVIGLKEALTANLPRNLAPGYAFASNYGTLMAHGSVSHEDGRQHIWRRKLEKIRRLPWSCSFELGTGLKTEQLCSPSLVVLTDGSIFCQWSSKQGVVGWTNEGGLPVPTERKLDPADLIKVDYTGLKEQLRQMGSAGLHL
jgi:hypothetical protein